MARFEDYVDRHGNHDELGLEIEKANQASQTRQEQSKTAEQWEQDYNNLKSSMGRQSNELGQLRQTVREQAQVMEKYLESQANSQQQEEEPDVTVDDIYQDPVGTIEKLASRGNREVAEKLESLEKAMAERESRAALEQFQKDFPNYQEVGQSTDMMQWIRERTYRVNLAQRADSGDIEAARELFEMYEDQKGVSTQRDDLQRENELRAATMESSTGNMPVGEETFSRAELNTYRIKARRGDLEAENYLRKNSQAIQAAYASGRIVD